MAYILHIETTTKNCSVALSKDIDLLHCQEIAEENFTHAERLHQFVEEVLKKNKITFKDLQAVSVSKGPGSYTGLRIGVSAAKGLCYALNIPLIALDTLEILARQIKIDSGLIIPMLDARRMEVFTAIYDQNYKQVKEVEALELKENSFEKYYPKTIYFIGDGASKFQSIVSKNENFIFNASVIFPSAKEMVVASYQKFIHKNFEDVAYFEPFYLKPFFMGK
jgi:tRNA threonylcarbamoyladenosine biosynthesis protein TsaB